MYDALLTAKTFFIGQKVYPPAGLLFLPSCHLRKRSLVQSLSYFTVLFLPWKNIPCSPHCQVIHRTDVHSHPDCLYLTFFSSPVEYKLFFLTVKMERTGRKFPPDPTARPLPLPISIFIRALSYWFCLFTVLLDLGEIYRDLCRFPECQDGRKHRNTHPTYLFPSLRLQKCSLVLVLSLVCVPFVLYG